MFVTCGNLLLCCFQIKCDCKFSLHPQGPRVSQRAGFSAQSAGPDMAQYHKISVGGGGGAGGGGGFYREEMRMAQGGARQQSRMDPETLSMHSMRQQMAQPVNNYVVDGSDAVSLVSDRDAVYGRSYAQSAVNGYSGQMRQSTMNFPPQMQRSLSGVLSRGGGMAGGEAEIIQQQQSFKGPAHRTISRITNRNRMSMGSMSGTLQHQMSSSGSNYGGGDRVDRGFIASAISSGSQGNLYMPRAGTLSRAMSIKSMHSVGRGMDIYGGNMEMGASMGNLSG